MPQITFSGYNQIDFNTVLNAVMAQEREPSRRLEEKKKQVDTEKTAMASLAARITALQTAAKALAMDGFARTAKAQSSDASVDASTATGLTTGTYSVMVDELAQAQVLASATRISDLSAIVATTGTLTLTASSGVTVSVSLTGPTTLDGLVRAINKTAETPARASVVQVMAGQYQLVLTSTATGTGRAFTVQSSLANGSGIIFPDHDGDGVSGNDVADLVQSARDASLTVNGVRITSATNIVTQAIPDTTMVLKQATPSPVTVTLSRDIDTVRDALKRLVGAYNEFLSFVTDQRAAAGAGKANISRDAVLRSFKDAVRQTLVGDYGNGSLTKLAQMGVALDAGGRLSINEPALAEAIEQSPEAVERLFRGDGRSGVFATMAELSDRYIRSGGLISAARNRLTEQARALSKRLDVMEAQLAIRRESLQREYAAADRAMTQLNSQATSLAGLAAQYRLF